MAPPEPTTEAPAWLDELQLAPGPPWHAMGTRSLAASAWLIVDDQRDAELSYKRRLLASVPEVVSGRRTGSDGDGGALDSACAELASLVASASGCRLDGDRPPLEAAALIVQEDLCVLVRHDDGTWRLDAGVVCFPSMWSLGDKLGLPVTAVHGPVPAYADELADRVDRFLDRMGPDRPVWRRNWLIHESPELHLSQPPPHPPEPPAVPDGLWLRSERQTLRRLPESGAIVFTIRTQQVPLSLLGSRPDVARGIAAAICSWSEALVSYRGAQRWKVPALSWLEGCG